VTRGAGRIAIAGRTDSTGSDAVNHRLAWTRARVVADHLRDQLGVAPGRLSWEGRGACCYVGDNRTSIGRQANRRAEVTWHPALEARP
jgi:outer membrane protein OmpA-like peptidoglycan-associated protein